MIHGLLSESGWDGRAIVGVMFYDSCPDGVFVNLLAIRDNYYGRDLFGKSATETPFHSMELDKLLLAFAQVLNVCCGWSQKIFLHENPAEAAIHAVNGFVRLPSNHEW